MKCVLVGTLHAWTIQVAMSGTVVLKELKQVKSMVVSTQADSRCGNLILTHASAQLVLVLCCPGLLWQGQCSDSFFLSINFAQSVRHPVQDEAAVHIHCFKQLYVQGMQLPAGKNKLLLMLVMSSAAWSCRLVR
jgi:hypothetical protein